MVDVHKEVILIQLQLAQFHFSAENNLSCAGK
jgi:hypothetical protein